MNKIIKLTSLLLLVVMCIGVLASCGISSYENRLEKAGYEVTTYEKEYIEKQNDERDDRKIKAGLIAGNSKDGEYVEVIKFASAKQAKAYIDEFDLDDAERKGAVVIYGTEAGVKAALGK